MRIARMQDKPAAPYIYVGRKMGGADPIEASPLGNPFKLHGKSAADIAECIANYRAWLYEKIQQADKQIMALIGEMTEEATLACWCVNLEGDDVFQKPERCHAQVIWSLWRYLRGEK